MAQALGWLVLGGRRFRLSKDRQTLGRSRFCDLRVIGRGISRRHAAFVRSPLGIAVYDLGSKNGLQVNGRPALEAYLHEGDRLSIGVAEFRFTRRQPRRQVARSPRRPRRLLGAAVALAAAALLSLTLIERPEPPRPQIRTRRTVAIPPPVVRSTFGLARDIELAEIDPREALALVRPRPKSAPPTNPAGVHGFDARLELERGDEERALERAREAHRIDPEQADAHLVLGSLALHRREFEQAAAHLDRALDRRSVFSAAQRARAEALASMGKFDAALADASAVGEFRIQVRALAALGRPDEAIAACGRWAEAEPESAEPCLVRGDLRLSRGDEAGAAADYELGLTREPGNEVLKSRLGSMAALKAPPPAPPDPSKRAADPRIEEAIRRGVRALRELKVERDRFGASYRVGVTALLAYTLLKCGEPATDPQVAAALRVLLSRDPEGIYSAGLAAMALAAAIELSPRASQTTSKPDPWSARLQRIANMLVASQCEQGGWTYDVVLDTSTGFARARRAYDLSNTQYAILGLRAAERAGARVPQQTWERLAKLLKSTFDGGWSYHGKDRPSFSMTAAGAYGWVACRAALEPELRPADLLKDDRIESALAYLARGFSPRALACDTYGLYSLERICMSLGVEKLGGADWYGRTAETLLSMQRGGLWDVSYGELVDTCLVLLFLRRAYVDPFIATGE